MVRTRESSVAQGVAFDRIAAKRRDGMLLVAILLMVPALAFAPALVAPEPGNSVAGSEVGAGRGTDGGGETVVSSSGWHPAIEHGSSLIGPVPGQRLGRPPVD
jgi:hypothetical protein